ncbi:MAG: cupin domain-containing protein [Dehalococcoidia bacterium]
MIFGNTKDVVAKEIKTFPFKSKSWPVKGTFIQWLSQVGDPAVPEYGLRLFTIKPGGFIPVHQHQYAQTEVMISGKLLAGYYDDNGKVLEEKVIGPGDFFYVPPMEIHGMKNTGKEDAKFYCCICVLGEECAV